MAANESGKGQQSKHYSSNASNKVDSSTNTDEDQQNHGHTPLHYNYTEQSPVKGSPERKQPNVDSMTEVAPADEIQSQSI